MGISKGNKGKANQKQQKNKRKEQQKEAREGKRTLLRKDPGLPNLKNIKQKLENKSKLLKEKMEKKKQFDQIKYRPDIAARRNGLQLSNLEKMAQDAMERAQTYDDEHIEIETSKFEHTREDEAAEQTRRAFFKQLKMLVKKSDVIIEVLDARDPMGCRAIEVERKILQKDPNKMIILVLNKIDLVPTEIVEQWLRRLRREFPAVAFKASTANRHSNVVQSEVKSLHAGSTLLSSSLSVGTDQLLQLLKNYSRNKSMKTAITVGIIGYPNVGKSSLINSLKRGRVVGVSAQPGFTKTIQEVQLDSKIQLIDCPGIIFETGNKRGKSTGGYLLRNCVDIQTIEDPETVVNEIVTRCPPEYLADFYHIPVYNSANEFICYVAQRRGKLAKGGIPDKLTACRCILYDWNTGKIPFYTLPPQEDISNNDVSIVNTFSNELKLGDIYNDNKQSIQNASNKGKNFMVLQSVSDSHGGMDIEEEGGDAWDDDDGVLDDAEIEKLLHYSMNKDKEQPKEQVTEEELNLMQHGQLTITPNTPAVMKIAKNTNKSSNKSLKPMMSYQEQIQAKNDYDLQLERQQQEMEQENAMSMDNNDTNNYDSMNNNNVQYTGDYFMNF
ncbi:hypothetical protein WA158_000196 [Blastocystis sp. Blastoise]